MNETNPTPPQFPPNTPPVEPAPPPPVPPMSSYAPRPLGDNPEERVPITSLMQAIEAILRQPRRVMYQLRQPGAGALMMYLMIIAILCAVIYGVVVGTFTGHDQLWIAPAKIAGGMLFSALICLPSLYIFACLSGSQAR